MTEPPAFIDYNDDAPEPEALWTSKKHQNHWNRLLVKYHGAGGFLWTIKHITLLKRLRKAYGPEELAEMMEYYVSHNELKKVDMFTQFYGAAVETHSKISQAKEGYSWN